MKTIIDYLDEHGVIDDESVGYAKPGDYPFTLEEFRAFYEKIWDNAGGWDVSDKYVVEGAYFETYYVPFEMDGKKYCLHVMFGQGSAWTVFTEAEHIEAAKRVSNPTPGGIIVVDERGNESEFFPLTEAEFKKLQDEFRKKQP